MKQNERTSLSLFELEAFDTGAPAGLRRRFLCPLCGADKPRDAGHRCLSVESASGLWNCFRCGAGGRLREFWPDGVVGERRPKVADFNTRRHKLSRTFELPSTGRTATTEIKVPEVAIPDAPTLESDAHATSQSLGHETRWRELWDGATALAGTRGEDYLARRAIEAKAAILAGVRFHATWPSGAAVIFPICDRMGECVAVQGRALSGSAKRTYGPKKEGVFYAPVALPSGRVLGPIEANVEAILITEAPIDALSLATCGFPALALCGTSGPSWLHLACGLRRVVLALDADEAGEKAFGELQTRLQPYGTRCECLVPEGAKDWNEALIRQGKETLSDWLALQLLTL